MGHGVHVFAHGAGVGVKAARAVWKGGRGIMDASSRLPGAAQTPPRRWPLVALGVFVLAAPWFLREFHLHLLTEIWILALFAAAFNLLFGYTGLLSFGQAGY